MKNRHYLDWVKTLPCCACGDPTTVDPHHRIGNKKGMSLRSSDFQTMPLCRKHHDELHNHGHQTFEEIHGDQAEMVIATLLRAIFEGRLVFR